MQKQKKYQFINVPFSDKRTVRQIDRIAQHKQVSRAAILRMAAVEYLEKNGVKKS